MSRAALLQLTRVTGAGLALTVALTACGVDTKDSGKPTAQSPAATTKTTVRTPEELERRRFERERAKLPKPTSGEVAVDGETQVGLTPAVVRRFGPTSGTTVRLRRDGGADGAFRDLCDGKVDIAESTRLITRAELVRCQQHGVRLLADRFGKVAPLAVGADAIVIATRNESDVGGDCLRTDTIRDIFRSGSPINNWSQVGFDDLPLATTGRAEDSATFQLFATAVLGGARKASRADVRSDYRVRTADARVRDEVTRSRRVNTAIRAARKRLARIRNQRSTRRARKLALSRARARAQAPVLARIQAENQSRARRRVDVRGALKQRIERDNLRRVRAAKSRATIAANRRFDARLISRERARFRTTVRAINRLGVVGVFRFSYYELFENLLRPIEVWDPQLTTQLLEQQGIATTSVAASASATTVGRVAPQQTGPTTSTAASPTTPGSTITTADGRRLAVPEGGAIDAARTPSCIFPSQQTITNGVYPFAQRVLLYVSGDRVKRREVQDYLGFYLRNAQSIAVANQLVPITDQTRENELALVRGDKAQGGGATSGQTPPRVTTVTTPTTQTAATGSTATATATATTATTATGQATTPTATAPRGSDPDVPGVGSPGP